MHSKNIFLFYFYRFCVCYKHKSFETLLQTVGKETFRLHVDGCRCECAGCASDTFTKFKPNISHLMKGCLCPATPKMLGTNVQFFNWSCLRLQCDHCWDNVFSHFFNCPMSNWTSEQGSLSFSRSYLFHRSRHLTDVFQ